MTGLGTSCVLLNLLHRCGLQDPQTSGNTPTGNQRLVWVFSVCFLKYFTIIIMIYHSLSTDCYN